MEILRGKRPEHTEEAGQLEPGEWRHGWQFYASSTREHHFREHVLLPLLHRPCRALLRSGSGPGAGQWLATLPVSTGTTMRPELFLVALRRRLFLPLGLGLWCCPAKRCQWRLHNKGHHLSACPWMGLLHCRAKPLERAWQQVLKEAGARVMPQPLLRDMDLAVTSADDGRQLDFVACGLSPLPLCGDATIVSPLDSEGKPKYGADEEDGAALKAARRRKCRRYPEVAQGDRARLVVLGCEVGGRWAEEAWQLLGSLAGAKSSAAPRLLQKAARMAWHRRWASLIAVAVQGAVAAALAAPPALNSTAPAEAPPELAHVLGEGDLPPSRSRLAWRAA